MFVHYIFDCSFCTTLLMEAFFSVNCFKQKTCETPLMWICPMTHLILCHPSVLAEWCFFCPLHFPGCLFIYIYICTAKLFLNATLSTRTHIILAWFYRHSLMFGNLYSCVLVHWSKSDCLFTRLHLAQCFCKVGGSLPQCAGHRRERRLNCTYFWLDLIHCQLWL